MDLCGLIFFCNLDMSVIDVFTKTTHTRGKSLTKLNNSWFQIYSKT